MVLGDRRAGICQERRPPPDPEVSPQITGRPTPAAGGEVLEPPRPQGAESVPRGPGSNCRPSRENRQAAVTPRPDPWASLYLVRIVGTGPRALMILVPHVCRRPRARADNPDKVEGRKEDWIWGAAIWAGLGAGASVPNGFERNHRLL